MSTHHPEAAAQKPAAPRATSHAGRFRPELHGVRGLAIGLVVLYHVWFGRVSGGVDVFLFLSAFLLTGTFLRRIDHGDPARPLAYWARTFKRLLPPTAVVVLATLAGVRAVLGPERWMPALTDALGSLLHVQNWVLIRRGVDYYAADAAGPSAFQHFWSLSIQGQVFLIWPLLIALTAFVARRLGRSVRLALAVMYSLVLVGSLSWSVYSTAVQQQIAYFDTATRLWEFAAGSLLALVLPVLEARRERRPRGHGRRAGPRPVGPRVITAWVGIAALVSCGLVVDVQGAFPGWIAAWPLTAAGLVLAAGTTRHPLSVDRLLSTRPARMLGDISYALYLVHWPLLTLYLAQVDAERAGPADGLVLIAASLVLAWVLTRLVDTPIRRWPWAGARPWRSAVVAVMALVLGAAPVIGAQQHLLGQQREAEARAVADNPGARVLDPDHTVHPDADPQAEVLPTAATLGSDWVSGDQECTGALAPVGDEKPRLDDICRVVPGEVGAPVIISVGNSRLEQFSASLIALAEREGWTLVTLWEGGCAYTPDATLEEPACNGFSADATSYMQRVGPDAIALNTTFVQRDGTEVVMPGMEQTLPRLTATGAQVIAVRDLPRMPFDPPACTQEKGFDHPDCAPPLAGALTEERPDAQLLDGTEGSVTPLQVTDLVCPEGVCSPVIGNVVVSIDDDHITGTYAASMADAVDDRLAEAGFTW